MISKDADDDPTKEKYQDRISEYVWLTRGVGGGLYNIKLEKEASSMSPIGTQWAYGACEDIELLEFYTQKEMAKECGRHQDMAGKIFCVLLEQDKVYLEFNIIHFYGKKKGTMIKYE